MKKILVPYYSQTGQLKAIIDSVLVPFSNTMDYSVDLIEIKPKKPFSFPWNAVEFFDAMPESVNEIPCELEPISFKYSEYDLIILPYQPWFLSPSIPINSFLKLPVTKQILQGKPIVTVIGCRNMWVMAQEKLKATLLKLDAKLVGNIAMVDRAGNLKSVITILRWMLYGKKGNSGVSQKDIDNGKAFGDIIKSAFEMGDYTVLQENLLKSGCLEIKPNLLLLEQRGSKAFKIYARFISAKGKSGDEKRVFRVKTLLVVLPTMVFILSPIITVFTKITLLVRRKVIEQEIIKYSLVA